MDKITLIKLLNDKYGNPRYYISGAEMNEKQLKALRERFTVRKYRGAKYGAGFAITAYLDASQLLDFINKIKE